MAARRCQRVIDLHQRLRSTLSDRYVIERELGSGGMAVVYLAQDLKHHRQVAIKVLRPEVAGVIGAARFLREIQIAAQLTHPRVVPLYDSGRVDGLLYYVMPFIDGESLRSRLNGDGPLPLEEALDITLAVAAALSKAHEHNIIHRDIKPENILFSGGEVVVADFGIARAISAAGGEAVSQSDIPIGTVGYMSPEQAMGSRDLDGRTDLYSLACVLYEMVVGKPPGLWFDEIRAEVIGAGRKPEWQRTLEGRLPENVTAALVKALSLYPWDRHETVDQFALALKAGVRQSGVGPAVSRQSRRFSTGVLAGAAMAVLLIGGGLGMWIKGADAAASEQPRVAVMSFSDRSQAADQYLADGVAQAIRNRLAGLSGLSVIAFYGSDEYQVTGKTISDIGEELGAEFLLRGTVQQGIRPDGIDVVRVNSELVRVRNATLLWADSYEVPLSGILKLQASIAEEIAQALDVAVLGPERQMLAAVPTDSPSAWARYVQGAHFYQRSSMLDDNRRALALFEQAVGIDSTFALAWAFIATAHAAVYATGGATPVHLELAQEAADRALSLEPGLPAGVLAQVMIHFARREFEAARDLAVEALQGRPNDYDMLYILAHNQLRLGNWGESIAAFSAAAELNPRRRPPVVMLAQAHLRLGDHDKAERLLDQAVRLGPDMADAWAHKAWLALIRDGSVAAAEQILREAANLCSLTDVIRQLLLLEPVQPMMALVDGEIRGALFELPRNVIGAVPESYYLSRAVAHEAIGQRQAALAYYDSLRVIAEEHLESEPDYALWHGLRGRALAGLGQMEAAVAEGVVAAELGSLAQDAWDGTDVLGLLAQIYVYAGDYEAAVDRLETLVRVPSRYSNQWLRLHPSWAPLRDHPRFQRLVGGGR
jgi:serine/threonine-protein kinase